MKAELINGSLRLLSLLPLSVQHALGKFIGVLAWTLPTKARAITKVNLDLCYPDKSPQWREHIGRESLIQTGKALFETGALWHWQQDRLCDLVTGIKNQRVLDDALSENRGLILASPHIGAWELIAIYIGARYPMVSMYRPSRSRAMDPIICHARTRFGGEFAPASGSGVRTILRNLSEGKIVGILPDQEPDREFGIFAPLFRTPACTMTLLGKLAARTKAPVVFCVMKRLKKGYEMHYLKPEEDFYNQNPSIAASAINQAIERCIAIAPEQYLWSYKRFRLLEKGGKRKYSAS